MRFTAMKTLLIAFLTVLFLQASTSAAYAGSSDLVWIVPVAILGTALITVVVIGAVTA